MRIGVDIDNVLYPFHDIMHWWAQARLGRELPQPPIWKNYEGWGISDAEFCELMLEGWRAGVVYTIGQPMTDETDRRIMITRSNSHEIVLITNRPAYAQRSTVEWVDRWGIPYSEIIVTDDKTKHGLDWLLDDAPHNVLDARRHGIKAVTFERDWNRHVPGPAAVSVYDFLFSHAR